MENETLLHTIVNHMRDPVFYLTADREIAYGNPALEALMPGRGRLMLSKLLPKDDAAAFEEGVEKALIAGTPQEVKVRVRQRSSPSVSSIRWFEIQLIPAGSGVLGVAHDIHEWKMREQRERERESTRRMEAIGLLAGEVAHEFANTVGGIAGIASYSLNVLDPADPTYADWDMVNRAAQRGTELTRDLLAVAGKRLLTREKLDLCELLRNVVKEIELMEPDIELDLRLPESALHIQGSRTQLHQVMRNLWHNARDAMQEGGGAHPCLRLILDTADDDGFVRITMEDNGPGIRDQNLARLFEPYFTTKEDRGTGLGLSIAYGIVQKHGGVLTAETIQGGGARLQLTLPAKKV